LVFFILLDIIRTVFLLESLYPAGGIDIFLLARIERMAHRTYLCVDFFCRTAGLKSIAAAAMNHYLIVFWMYPFFHNYSIPIYLKHFILTISAAFSIRNFHKLEERFNWPQTRRLPRPAEDPPQGGRIAAGYSDYSRTLAKIGQTVQSLAPLINLFWKIIPMAIGTTSISGRNHLSPNTRSCNPSAAPIYL